MGADQADVPPCETVYINNLNDRINIDELTKSLYAIFSQFGPIMDVVARKTLKMRGQAFVVFRDISSATTAVRQMQGFPFYDKPMRLSYAKTKSDATAKLDGTFELKAKAERQAKRKAERLAAAQAETKRPAKSVAATDAAAAQENSGPSVPAAGAPPRSVPGSAPPPLPNAVAGPNPILFVENLPEAVNEMMLSMLFQQFPGYKEVRLVPGKAGIAFVEFETDAQSGTAMAGLQNFKITPQNLMKVSYAKR